MTLYFLIEPFEPRTYVIIYVRKKLITACYLFDLDAELNKENKMDLYSHIVKIAFIENDILNIILKEDSED